MPWEVKPKPEPMNVRATGLVKDRSRHRFGANSPRQQAPIDQAR